MTKQIFLHRVRPLSNDGVKSNYLLHFPKEHTLYDVDWIAVISRRRRSILSQLLVDQDTKLLIPAEKSIGRLRGRNGLTSSGVIVLDAKTVMIADLIFRGLAPETHFWVGLGHEPDEFGQPMAVDGDEDFKPVGRVDNETLVLNIPYGRTIYDFDYIGLWSRNLGVSLAYVKIPRELNVPPAADDLGIEPEVRIVNNVICHMLNKSKNFNQEKKNVENRKNFSYCFFQTQLNCEKLSYPGSPIDLELRWSITTSKSDDRVIIIQMVSTSGKDRYVALGLRVAPEELHHRRIAGDVIVGWINSNSGRGGISDYFLAGDHKVNSGAFVCSDGAESCPDKTYAEGAERNPLPHKT